MPTKYDDVIDSRSVIARVEDLEAERAELAEELGDAADTGDNEALQRATFALATWEERNGAELAALRGLVAEAEGCGDWEYGEVLVRDSYFKEYAQQLAEDCGMVPHDLKWPLRCIDWDAAARELKMDYTCVDFDGVTYWIRY